VLAEASSSSQPGGAERLERSCLAIHAQHDRDWIELYRHSHQGCRQGRSAQLEAAPPLARRRHRHAQLVGHRPHPLPCDYAEYQSLADHLDLVESTLQQKIRQQRVRVQASRAPTTSNPQSSCARAAYPAPVPTPPTEPPPITLWTRACMLAYLDPLSQREVGRHT